MDILVQRDLHSRMAEDLAQRFDIHPRFNAAGGKSVAKRVKGARGDLQGAQAGFIAVEICPGLQKSVIAGQ